MYKSNKAKSNVTYFMVIIRVTTGFFGGDQELGPLGHHMARGIVVIFFGLQLLNLTLPCQNCYKRRKFQERAHLYSKFGKLTKLQIIWGN